MDTKLVRRVVDEEGRHVQMSTAEHGWGATDIEIGV